MNEPLTLEDFRSPTWRKVKAYCEAELKQHRINLEADQTPERTAILRGSIRSHVKILALENPPTLVIEEEGAE
jgi:hypothetical protein